MFLYANSNSEERAIMFNSTSGESSLKSPALPWNTLYKNIEIGLSFDYKLPVNTDTPNCQLVVGLKSQPFETKWSLRGYHGNEWKTANIPLGNHFYSSEEVRFLYQFCSNRSSIGVA